MQADLLGRLFLGQRSIFAQRPQARAQAPLLLGETAA